MVFCTLGWNTFILVGPLIYAELMQGVASSPSPQSATSITPIWMPTKVRCFHLPQALPIQFFPNMVVIKSCSKKNTVRLEERDVCTPVCWGGKYPSSIPRWAGKKWIPKSQFNQFTTLFYSIQLQIHHDRTSKAIFPPKSLLQKTSAPRSKSWPKRESELHNWGVSHIYPEAAKS